MGVLNKGGLVPGVELVVEVLAERRLTGFRWEGRGQVAWPGESTAHSAIFY